MFRLPHATLPVMGAATMVQLTSALGCLRAGLCAIPSLSLLTACLQRRWFLSCHGCVCFVELHCVVPDFPGSGARYRAHDVRSLGCRCARRSSTTGAQADGVVLGALCAGTGPWRSCPQGQGSPHLVRPLAGMDRHVRKVTTTTTTTTTTPSSWSGRGRCETGFCHR